MSRSKANYPNAGKFLTAKSFKHLGCSKRVGFKAVKESEKLSKTFKSFDDFAASVIEKFKSDAERALRSQDMQNEKMKMLIEELMIDEKNESDRRKKERERKKASEEEQKRKIEFEEKDDEDIHVTIQDIYSKKNTDKIIDSMMKEAFKESDEEDSKNLRKRLNEERRQRLDNGNPRSDDEYSDSDDDDESKLVSKKKSPAAEFNQWIGEKARKGEFVIEGNPGITIKEVLFDSVTGQIKILV
jgi:hypothetical protein